MHQKNSSTNKFSPSLIPFKRFWKSGKMKSDGCMMPACFRILAIDVRGVGRLFAQDGVLLRIRLGSGQARRVKHPFLAPISVILCMQTTSAKSLNYAYLRFIGTFLGVAVAAWARRMAVVMGIRA
ncbi:FUSC family protein [Cohnella sp. CFH 77786]|uniref:FUSC family protein n=1 Tax=Cohnella sp. CFH 77786 TaxID=2662265 RepID=UPI00351CE4B4